MGGRKSTRRVSSSGDDWKAVAQTPAYQDALNDLAQTCGTRPYPLGGKPGAFSYHVHSAKRPLDLHQVQQHFAKAGCFVFAINSNATRVAIMPTLDKYVAVAAMQTNGTNYGLMPQDIIRWLRKLEKEQPFTLTGIGFDFLSGKFTTKIIKPDALARRMFRFCPDISPGGSECLQDLATELATERKFFFWWD